MVVTDMAVVFPLNEAKIICILYSNTIRDIHGIIIKFPFLFSQRHLRVYISLKAFHKNAFFFLMTFFISLIMFNLHSKES